MNQGATLDTGIRHVRNQGVLLCGVNDSAGALLDLSFTLLDGANILPYYFYMCDMIPGSEHWRVSLAQARPCSIRSWVPARVRHGGAAP